VSKPETADMSRINLSDPADEMMKKVKKAKTDPEPLPSEAAGLADRPEALNLVTIYAALAGESVDTVLGRFGGQGFGTFKPALGEVLVETMAPISARFRQLCEDRESLEAILARGAAQAREIGSSTLDATYSALGLVRRRG
jgi:tryptophanyl-tRNA synthetase